MSSEESNNELNLHQSVVEGFTDASSYNASRPTYPPEVFDQVITVLQENQSLQPSTDGTINILELGAGTGIFTRDLVKRLPENIHYLATDPLENLLEKLQENMNSAFCETAVMAAEKLSVPDKSVHAIIGAQCFHWFATATALAEIYRVLKDNGVLILVWNIRDDTNPCVQDLNRIIAEHYLQANTPFHWNDEWKTAFQQFPHFNAIHLYRTPVRKQFKTKAEILAWMSTISVIFCLESASKAATLARFRNVLDQHFPASDEAHVAVCTEVYWCYKK